MWTGGTVLWDRMVDRMGTVLCVPGDRMGGPDGDGSVCPMDRMGTVLCVPDSLQFGAIQQSFLGHQNRPHRSTHDPLDKRRILS